MTNARANRGNGNGKNKNWYDSPLWDAIDKKKQEQKDADKTHRK